jgi:hypothetical protein
MKWILLIPLVLLTSCVFTDHSPSEDSLTYEQNPTTSIVVHHNFWSEKFDYTSWKLLYDVDRGYVYDEWMTPYGSRCAFGDYKVYRWVGLPKVYDTIEECEKEKRLL